MDKGSGVLTQPLQKHMLLMHQHFLQVMRSAHTPYAARHHRCCKDKLSLLGGVRQDPV
jgi:hypothetical protein